MNIKNFRKKKKKKFTDIRKEHLVVIDISALSLRCSLCTVQEEDREHNTEVHEYRKVKKEKTHTPCPFPFSSHLSPLATSPKTPTPLSHGL